jgi:ATP-binding cassette subfamily C protein CydD
MAATTESLTDDSAAASDARARRWLAREGHAVRGHVAAAACAGGVATAAVIVQAGLIAWVIHAAVIEGRGLSGLWPWLAGAAAAAVARAAADRTRRALGLAAGARVRRDVRARLVEHAGRLGPLGLGAVHSGALAGRAVEQIEALDGYFARYQPQLVLALAAPLAIGAAAVSQDWLAGLFLFAAAPLIPLFMALVGMGAERLSREQFEVMNRLAGHFLDRVRGLPTLQLFAATRRARAEIAGVSDQYRQRAMRTLRVAFLSSAVLEFFSSVAIAVIAIYVGFGLLGYVAFGPADELTLFSGLFVLLLAPEFFQPLRTLAQHYHDRAAAIGAARTLLEVLERPVPQPAGTHPEARAAVALRGIRVAYDGGAPVLRDFDLAIRTGECVALVGPSGSGKSTVLGVVAGFVTPQRGSVTVLGRRAGVPGASAWIGQRPFLAHGTIADNIRLAAPDADAGAVEAAAARAGVMDFAARLPRGLDTPLGERGAGLSGGEGQRVALARAFLSPAPLVLLDEPTAGLDAQAEARVLEGVRGLIGQGRTVIAATHHPAVRALMDREIHLTDPGGDPHA